MTDLRKVTCPLCKTEIEAPPPKELLLDSGAATVAIWNHQAFRCPGCKAKFRWMPMGAPIIKFGFGNAGEDTPEPIEIVKQLPSKIHLA